MPKYEVEEDEEDIMEEQNTADNYQSHHEVVVDIQDVSTGLLEKVERETIYEALKVCETQTETAKLLGISVRTLRNKINKHFKNQEIVH